MDCRIKSGNDEREERKERKRKNRKQNADRRNGVFSPDHRAPAAPPIDTGGAHLSGRYPSPPVPKSSDAPGAPVIVLGSCAQSRPRAGCKSARGHRPRPATRHASGPRPMRRDLNLYVTKTVTIRQRVEDEMFSRLPAQNSRAVMAGHSHSKNGAAELVSGRPLRAGPVGSPMFRPSMGPLVMAGLVPAIHNFVPRRKTSMPQQVRV